MSAAAVFTPRTAVIRIYTGDYLNRIRHLEQQFEEALQAEKGTTPTADESQAYQLAQAHEQLVAEAEDHAFDLTVQALPRRVWKQLVSEHPPRTESTQPGLDHRVYRLDHLAGVNEDTFAEALVTSHGHTTGGKGTRMCPGGCGEEITGYAYATIVDTPDWWDDDKHLDALSTVDFERLYLGAFRVNRGEIEDPKASLVSRMIQTSEETSS